jgi:predicted peptidase
MRKLLFMGLLSTLLISPANADEWSALPSKDGAVEIPAQEWSLRPGPRKIRILIHFPDGTKASVQQDTGLMLTLHNWGGTDCVGTASPVVLARKLNVVAICVNYLQSGQVDSIQGPEPYDFGYLQGLDALRALWFVRSSLQEQNIRYNDRRIYSTGGSGGGNVTLMANKLAPRTFAAVIDMCGMKKLSDDIAFNLPGGSDLNARWSQDSSNPFYLSLDAQELRFVGNPDHLREMKRLGTESQITVIHGVDDKTCPFSDAQEMVALMQAGGLKVKPIFVDQARIDGKTYTSTGHSLGDRTRIVLEQAGVVSDQSTLSEVSLPLRSQGQTDFDHKDVIRYRTSSGAFLIDYSQGFPVGRFEAETPLPEYPNHQDLSYRMDSTGQRTEIKQATDWEHRRDHIRRHLERITGKYPSPLKRVPLNPVISEEVTLNPPAVSRPLLRRKLTYQSDSESRVPAYVFIPLSETVESKLNSDQSTAKITGPYPAVLCLQQTTSAGKDEPAGLQGDPDMKYAIELAEAGFVTIAPDYPSFGEYTHDFEADQYQSGSMKAIWDNSRAIDLLETMPEVDRTRIGCIGHSLGGHNAIFTGQFEPRIQVIVSSCGFTSLSEDDLPSWTGPRYMPLIATSFENDIRKMPVDFHELIAALAPRPFMACYAEKDDDFSASGVRHVLQQAESVYKLYNSESRLLSVRVEAGHSFPKASRERAYRFLSEHLQHQPRPNK